jgi:hypothetical protein
MHLKTASFRLRRFRKLLNNNELAQPKGQKCNNCFAHFRLLDQKSKSCNYHVFNNITNPRGRTKDKQRAKPKRGIPVVSPLHFEKRESHPSSGSNFKCDGLDSRGSWLVCCFDTVQSKNRLLAGESVAFQYSFCGIVAMRRAGRVGL